MGVRVGLTNTITNGETHARSRLASSKFSSFRMGAGSRVADAQWSPAPGLRHEESIPGTGQDSPDRERVEFVRYPLGACECV